MILNSFLDWLTSVFLGKLLFLPAQWCSAPPSCPLLLRTWTVRAVQAQVQVAAWARGAACPPYTAWFSHKTSCTRPCPTPPLASLSAPENKPRSWLVKCCWMSVWLPAECRTAGAFGTGWGGAAVGQLRLRPAKLPKVPVVRELEVCAAAEAPVVVMVPTSVALNVVCDDGETVGVRF